MEILMIKDRVIQEINEYTHHNCIWAEIWEMSQYEVQVVVTVNKEQSCHLGDHKVLHICSAKTDDANDVRELKRFGKSMVRMIRRKFPAAEVHSRLYY